MSMPSKFDISSASPDRPLSTNGLRGSHLASQFDRSSSFRDSMENPILLSVPNMTRSSSVVSQGDIKSFFHCVRFDPKVVAADHKSSHHGDFKQHIDAALGISLDDSGFLKGKMLTSCIPDEIKRVKADLRESSDNARERMKIFNEALSVFNKFFPSVPSKKRSRLEGCPGDRTGAVLSSDRPFMGPGLSKTGAQNHVITSSIELEQQKLGERPRNAVPKKRTRTSLVDVKVPMQSNTQVKPSGALDREKEISRPTNCGMILAEDRTTLSIAVDGWEKTKMKKKRSGIKPDVSTSISTTKPTDSYREPKPGLQQRPITDSRSRLNNDNNGFSRMGVSNGALGIGKSDSVVQSVGLSVRSSIPRADPDNTSLLNELKERSAGLDKDRVNFKPVHKANVRDELNSASPTSCTKMNATVRAPRSSAGSAPKSSPIIHRATGPHEWEQSHSANNKPVALGSNNRKRSAATGSSSPPVAHWAGQRPQKISRTARRTNLVPIVPSNEENASLEAVSDVSGNETGLGFARLLNTSSPRQVKMKGEPSSASEESGAPEIKSKEKGKGFEEMEVGQSVQKLSMLEMASRKNKQIAKEDIGEGVRRKGRTGRGFASTRSLAPVSTEKLGNVGIAKQLGSSRLGFDKTGSKPGRPPTRKLSDRKGYTRQKHAIANVSADFHVGSDDGNEELLVAASDALNPDSGISGLFWRKMESFFRFICDDDIAYLKQQVKLELPSPIPSDVSSCQIVHNGNESVEDETDGLPNETSNFEFSRCLEPVARDVPLFQRLLTAIIPEEDDITDSGELELDAHGTGFDLDEDLESDVLNNDNLQLSGCISNGYNPASRLENGDAEVGMLETPTMGFKPSLSPSAHMFLSNKTMTPARSNSEFHYDDLHIDEKLHLEVQSLGMSIESSIEDGGISEEINKLQEKACRQALKKKGLLDKLLNSALEAKELQEQEFERHAHDKLVTMAYEKYLACSGPHATGGKGSRNKMAKQAALAFVKRTLLQCHRFEDTGKSCFSEPLFREMFLARSSQQNGVGLDAPTDGECSKRYDSSSRSWEGRVSASVSSQPSPKTSILGKNGENDIASSPDLRLHASNHLLEQESGNEDLWSSRMKQRELLLDDVGGGIVGNSPIGPSGIGGSLPSTTKGKRSERDREGKGHNREVVSRSGTVKLGRPAVYAKGERKSKTKPKQKTAQLSVSLNGPVGKIAGQPKSTLPSESTSSGIVKNNSAKEKDGLGLNVLNEPEDIVFSNLLGIDDDGQGNDLGAWLNIDDDGLQDHDFMGLEIPMDDLSDLNMMV